MGASIRVGDDPLDALKALKAQRAPVVSDDPLEQLKALEPSGSDIHQEFASGRLAKRMARENTNDAEQADAETPSYATKALGGIASLARDIPGAEAAQAGASALVNRIPYAQARGDIRDAEDAAPGVVRNFNRVAGGAVAAAALPTKLIGKTLTPALQGAALGAAGGALQSDPNAGLGTRAADAGIGAAVGGVVGKVGDAATNFARAKLAPSLGSQAAGVDNVRNVIDRQNYGKTNVDAWANGGTDPAIQAALKAPDVAPYVDAVRSSRTLAGADDATVLKEAYKLMSERQKNLTSRVLNTDDFKAGSQLEQNDITAGKGMLSRAASNVMPSFPQANADHAAIAAVDDARTTGSQLAKATLGEKQVGDKKLLRTSTEALMQRVPNMTTGEADASLNGFLSRSGDYTKFSMNPLNAVKTVFNATPAAKMSPAIRALEQQRGSAPLTIDMLRKIIAAEGHPTP